MASVNSSLFCCLVLCLASVSAQLLCRDRPDLLREKCDEYFQKGGIKTILEDLKTVGEFDDDLRLKFLDAIATVSDDYVILTVTSAQVVMTAVTESAGMVEVSYFVLNPSGSEVVPTAFRSEELFLMMTLNDNNVENLFGQAVKPVDPSPETLPIPVWAIAIIVYAAIVILCAGTLYATRDWRKLRQQNLERSLQMESVEKGKVYNDTSLPMADIHKNYGSAQSEPVVVYSEAGVQTSASFRARARAAKKAMAKAEEAKNTNNGNAVATIEKDAIEVTTDNHEYVVVAEDDTPTETAPSVEPIAVESAGEENTKDTDPIVDDDKHPDVDTTTPDTNDGVVNEAFDGDDDDDDDQESESDGEQAYQITDIDQVDDDGNPIAASDDEDTAF